jgi:ribosome-binding protein aMBF1 (putative translation factor)
MRTPFGAYLRAQWALIGRRLVRTADGHVRAWEFAYLRTTRQTPTSVVRERSQNLIRNLALLTNGGRENRRARALVADRTLQALVADLIAARTAAGMTQQDVAARMRTTKSVVSRLESGVRTRPTLSTVEKYALAVGAQVEIRQQAGEHYQQKADTVHGEPV